MTSVRARRTGPLSIQGEQQAIVQDALWATPEEGAAFIAALPPQYRQCREDRHVYMPFRVEEDRAARTLNRVRRCACGAEQEQLLDARTGRVLEAKKIRRYGEGYLAKGIGRLPPESKDALRLDVVHREQEALGQQAAPRRR
jgi:hypothetical protein